MLDGSLASRLVLKPTRSWARGLVPNLCQQAPGLTPSGAAAPPAPPTWWPSPSLGLKRAALGAIGSVHAPSCVWSVGRVGWPGVTGSPGRGTAWSPGPTSALAQAISALYTSLS